MILYVRKVKERFFGLPDFACVLKIKYERRVGKNDKNVGYGRYRIYPR